MFFFFLNGILFHFVLPPPFESIILNSFTESQKADIEREFLKSSGAISGLKGHLQSVS